MPKIPHLIICYLESLSSGVEHSVNPYSLLKRRLMGHGQEVMDILERTISFHRQGYAKVRLWSLDPQTQWLDHCSVKQAHKHSSLSALIRKHGCPVEWGISDLPLLLRMSVSQLRVSTAATSTLGKHWVESVVKWFECSNNENLRYTYYSSGRFRLSAGGGGRWLALPKMFALSEKVQTLLNGPSCDLTIFSSLIDFTS